MRLDSNIERRNQRSVERTQFRRGQRSDELSEHRLRQTDELVAVDAAFVL